MELKYVKKSNDNYIKLRQVLKEEFLLSSKLITKLKKYNNVSINNSNSYLDKLLINGDVINVTINFEEDNSNIISTHINLDILYEDEYFLILNKPAGIPVHPSVEHYTDSLSNGVKYYFDSINLKRKIRPVNRLDRNTSGIVVFAKNEYIQECLAKQMKNKTFKKEYIAICDGIFKEKSGTINAPISRKDGSIIERCVSENGDIAITKYTVINEFNNMSELLIDLQTGKTHQIRVHTSYLGHPIIRR
jgi:23S rRNA pseudouridine1911/1915/1917 synthase